MPSEDEMPKRQLEVSEMGIIPLIKALGYFATTGDARNGVSGGGVRVNGEVVNSIEHVVRLSASMGVVIQSGKKKFTLVFGK